MKINKQIKPIKDDKVVIGDEWTGNDKVEYTCNYCNCVLVKLRDIGGKNSSLWCRTCSIEYPDENEVRKRSKLETPNKNAEVCVTSIQTNMRDEVEIRHTPEIRGSFLELQKKGLRIKDYHTTEKQ